MSPLKSFISSISPHELGQRSLKECIFFCFPCKYSCSLLSSSFKIMTSFITNHAKGIFKVLHIKRKGLVIILYYAVLACGAHLPCRTRLYALACQDFYPFFNLLCFSCFCSVVPVCRTCFAKGLSIMTCQGSLHSIFAMIVAETFCLIPFITYSHCSVVYCRYVCCAGYMPCSGKCGESRCPEFCLATEVQGSFNLPFTMLFVLSLRLVCS